MRVVTAIICFLVCTPAQAQVPYAATPLGLAQGYYALGNYIYRQYYPFNIGSPQFFQYNFGRPVVRPYYMPAPGPVVQPYMVARPPVYMPAVRYRR